MTLTRRAFHRIALAAGSNANHDENPQADHLLDAAAVEPDMKKRAQLFKDFQVIIARDLSVINLVSPIQQVEGSKRVRNDAYDAEGLGGNLA